MKLVTKNKTSLFLMELIVVTLFFSIAVAICVRIFSSGNILSKKSQALTYASIEARNITELINFSNGDLDKACEYYGVEGNGEGITVYFSDKFTVCSKEESSYKMEVKSIRENSLVLSDIKFTNSSNSDEIYSLSIKTFSKGGNSYE